MQFKATQKLLDPNELAFFGNFILGLPRLHPPPPSNIEERGGLEIQNPTKMGAPLRGSLRGGNPVPYAKIIISLQLH
jgi:hypothetical protein